MSSLISIIIPIYNEEKNIPELYAALVELFRQLPQYELEIMFVDDGSQDSSVPLIQDMSEKDKRVKYIELSRNFGKEIATSAGIHHASGHASIMMDADLQHPVSLIPEFLQKWEAGTQVVIGVRASGTRGGLFRRTASWLFNKAMATMSTTKMIPRATDFRLIDKVVTNAFKQFPEHNQLTRGLIDWLGFKQEAIPFEAPRLHGKARYTKVKIIRLAFTTFVTHSFFPLRLAGYLGMIIMSISAPLGLFIFIEKYILNDPWQLQFSGPAILAVIILFLIGLVLTCLGLIALYIENIHTEVTNRPLYVIKNSNISL